MKFMQTHKVYLTPISPIHIGCGEDFEPTNYVIEQNLLYYFEPSKLNLDPKSTNFRELSALASKGDYEGVKKFFIKNKNLILDSQISSYQTLVPTEFKNEWENKFIIQNRLEIERNAYLPSPFNQPYIPSSGLKGAIATAILDYEHKTNSKIEKEKTHKHLLEKHIGLFKDSDLRLVKFADFIPTHKNVLSQVFYAVNFEKFEDDLGGLSVRRECIIDRQYRSFSCDLTFIQNESFQFIYLKESIIDRLNTYYLSTFKKEMEILVNRKLVSQKWFDEIIALLNKDNIALIRLGKNGSDSKVYQDKSIVKIKTKKEHKKYQKTIFEILPESTTIWLAKENNKSKEQIAFGWALLEFDISSENKPLLNWCNQKSKPSFNKEEFLLIQKNKQQEQKAKKAKLQAEEIAKQQAKLAAEKAKAEMLNSLSDNQRLVMAFVEKLNETRERQADNTGSPLLKEAEALINQATEWDITDRQFVFEQITADFLKSKIDFKKKDTEKNVKKWRNKLGIE